MRPRPLRHSQNNRVLRRFVLTWVVVLVVLMAVSGIIYAIYRGNAHEKDQGPPTSVSDAVPAELNASVVRNFLFIGKGGGGHWKPKYPLH